MALNIEDVETVRMGRELAELTGQPIDAAVRDAIEARLAELRRRRQILDRSDLTAIIDRGRARCTVGDEILGYDEQGLPA